MHLKLLVIIFIFIICSCSNNNAISEKFISRAKEIQKELVPDLSLGVFEVSLSQQNDRWVLKGETNNTFAREKIFSLADSILGSNIFLNELELLPSQSLGDSVYGIVMQSVIHLRKNPRHSAELVDQTIMGWPIKLLKEKNGWYLAQTHYNYTGWIKRYSIQRTDLKGLEEWNNHADISIKALQSVIYSQPDINSDPVTDVVLNGRLKLVKNRGQWSEVLTPDNQSGFILSTAITKFMEPGEAVTTNPSNGILKTAMSMKGLSYMWGGNSSKGNDCSGYTQNVFMANGLLLPRDARQQALIGERVMPDENFSNIILGDLLFFGESENITHVAISLGGFKFIHQGGAVAIESLNDTDEDFSSYRKNTLKMIKRVY